MTLITGFIEYLIDFNLYLKRDTDFFRCVFNCVFNSVEYFIFFFFFGEYIGTYFLLISFKCKVILLHF